MESSTVLAFRIFVMLSCLIIVPLAAIFGSAFPDVVKTVLVDRIVALSTGRPAETPATSDPNGFRTVAPGAETPNMGAPGATEPGSTWGTAPAWNGPAVEMPAAQPSGGTPATAAVVPVGGPTNPASGYNQSASYSAPAGNDQGAAQAAAAISPPTYPGAPSTMPGAPGAGPAACGDRNACALEQTDPFTDMERRLRQYGASYYLLETWGASGELYRFHCRMAVANNSAYTRHFEATDPDALKAMADVLAQVEAWRSGAGQ